MAAVSAATPPEQCRGRAYRILDSGGNIVKEVGAPLTPEQKAELILENKRRKQLEDAGREQRRRDQALLDTYTTAEDIDLAQKKAEADVNLAIQATNERIATAQKAQEVCRRGRVLQEKALPPELEKDLRAIDHEIRLQQELIALKQKEFDTIKAKYDADRKRYFELTRKSPTTPPGGAVPATLISQPVSFQQVVDLLRVGLALGRLHHLTDQRIEGLFLAGLEFGDVGCVGGEYVIDQRLDGARVGNLLQTLLVDHLVRGRPSPFHNASNTFLAMLLEMVLSAMRWIRPPSC
jgi:hypothetical protein